MALFRVVLVDDPVTAERIKSIVERLDRLTFAAMERGGSSAAGAAFDTAKALQTAAEVLPALKGMFKAAPDQPPAAAGGSA